MGGFRGLNLFGKFGDLFYRVAVMDKGNIIEFDSPFNLLMKDSIFKEIVDQSRDSKYLYEAAGVINNYTESEAF